MASILSGFEYDIFISYRHNDNLDGWVTAAQIQMEGSFYYPFIASIIITLSVPTLRIVFTTVNAGVTRLGIFFIF